MVKHHPSSYPLLDQHERAFQKQPQVYLGAAKRSKASSKKKANFRKTVRYVKDIGLGYKTPLAASTGDYVDKKCPWTSDVTIRGRILRGKVVSAGKMSRTIVLRRDYLHYVKKYNRYEKRHSNLVAHVSPAIRVKEGDLVEVGECRPLAKSVKFNLLKVLVPADDLALSKFAKF